MKKFKGQLKEKVKQLKILLVFKFILAISFCNIVGCKPEEVSKKNVEISHEEICLEIDSILKKVEIDSIVLLLEEIEKIEWNYCYGVFCEKTFESITVGDVFYEKVIINLGGWGYLQPQEGYEKYIGCKSYECWKLFNSRPMCDSLGNIIE